MTRTNMDLSELLAKHDQGDFLRGIAEAVLQLIMETDVEGIIGASRHERSGERTTWRNGYRERALDTRLGTLNLRVPKLRQGSCFPGFLEARKTSEQALMAVIQEAWIGGHLGKGGAKHIGARIGHAAGQEDHLLRGETGTEQRLPCLPFSALGVAAVDLAIDLGKAGQRRKGRVARQPAVAVHRAKAHQRHHLAHLGQGPDLRQLARRGLVIDI